MLNAEKLSVIKDANSGKDAQVQLLTAAERQQLLVTWNDTTTVAYPDYTTLCQLFEGQVARRPHAIAISSIDGTLSYQELNEKANQLAHMLRKQGVQADTLVGICMDRSTEMLVALLGILKAGGAYVPIDPMYPTDRIAYMLEDSQVQCLLTQQHLLPLLVTTTTTTTIEDLTRILMQQIQANPKTPLIPVQVTASGSKKPFFFLHGDWSGGAYYCFKLARKAGSDQPFYVLEPSIFPESQEIPTIEGQAAAHIELMRTVQPEGPYYLGGYCNGSIIAYEMAQQLQEQGEQVNFLAMIDPPSESLAKNFAHFFTDILHLKERRQWKTYLYTRHIYIRKIRPLLLHLSKTVDEQLTKGIQVSIEKDQAFTRLLPSMKTLREDYGSIFAWAFQHYTRKPYHGKVTFIWAREELTAETNNFWSDRAQIEEAESHVIKGSHYGILTDEIEAFAECLGTELQKAQAQHAGDPVLS